MESAFPDIGTGVPGVPGCGDPILAGKSGGREAESELPIRGRKEAQAQMDGREGGR